MKEGFLYLVVDTEGTVKRGLGKTSDVLKHVTNFLYHLKPSGTFQRRATISEYAFLCFLKVCLQAVFNFRICLA